MVKINSYEKVVGATLATMLAAFSAIGLWLVLANFLTLPGIAALPGFVWLGIIVGAAFVIMTPLYWRVGGFHPATMVAGRVWQIGYPIWAIWLGRLMLSGRLTVSG